MHRALLAERDSGEGVLPIETGIKQVAKMGIMEIFFYSSQLKRIARGHEPKPGQNSLLTLFKALAVSGWGTFRRRRVRN